jgi:hypothetical protein
MLRGCPKSVGQLLILPGGVCAGQFPEPAAGGEEGSFFPHRTHQLVTGIQLLIPILRHDRFDRCQHIGVGLGTLLVLPHQLRAELDIQSNRLDNANKFAVLFGDMRFWRSFIIRNSPY